MLLLQVILVIIQKYHSWKYSTGLGLGMDNLCSVQGGGHVWAMQTLPVLQEGYMGQIKSLSISY